MDQAEAEAERAVEAARKAQIAAMGAEGRALSRWLGIKPSALASPSNLEKAFGFEPRPLSPRQKATRAEWKAAKEALAAGDYARIETLAREGTVGVTELARLLHARI